jgi:hypothetical protein
MQTQTSTDWVNALLEAKVVLTYRLPAYWASVLIEFNPRNASQNMVSDVGDFLLNRVNPLMGGRWEVEAMPDVEFTTESDLEGMHATHVQTFIFKSA